MSYNLSATTSILRARLAASERRSDDLHAAALRLLDRHTVASALSDWGLCAVLMAEYRETIEAMRAESATRSPLYLALELTYRAEVEPARV